MVTHFVAVLDCDSAFCSSSRAPFCFLSLLTSDLIAFSAHASSPSPCFHRSSSFTTGADLNEKNDNIPQVPELPGGCGAVNINKSNFYQSLIVKF